MVSPSPDETERTPGPETVREVSRLVLEHPVAVYDPAWLRKLHDRCLWDGGGTKHSSGFCSSICEERYAEWEQRTSHVVLGREPIQTFLEQGRPVP